MLSDRGIAVDHTTLFRWVQAYWPSWRNGSDVICGRAPGRELCREMGDG